MDEGRAVEERVAGEIPATDREKSPHGGSQGPPLLAAKSTAKLSGQGYNQRGSRRKLGESRQSTDGAEPKPLPPRRRRTGRDGARGGAPRQIQSERHPHHCQPVGVGVASVQQNEGHQHDARRGGVGQTRGTIQGPGEEVPAQDEHRQAEKQDGDPAKHMPAPSLLERGAQPVDHGHQSVVEWRVLGLVACLSPALGLPVR